MEIDDYIKQNPDFAFKQNKTKQPQVKAVNPVKTKKVDGGVVLRFVIMSIITAILGAIFGFSAPLMGAKMDSIVLMIVLGFLCTINSILSIAYVIAAGVYIGVNS